MKMANWVLPVLFSASLAQAGGWQSSGGERFKDAKNPWFLANTAQVNYCVRVDTATVSASEATVKRLIEEGFAYWKSEFSRTMTATVGATPIATQTFTEVPCSLGIADLEFLVGYGTLSSAPNNDQIGFLEVPEKYIGVTVRTDYDTVRLRGKGFIYIASDIGPHSYLGQESDLNALTLIPNAWKYDRLLGYAILHELGHVFGLPHTGSGLMSEVFLEQMLNKNIYQIFDEGPLEPFFFTQREMESCDFMQGADKVWFGAPLDARCLKLVQDKPDQPIDVYVQRANDTMWTKIGRFEGVAPNMFDIRHRPAVHVQLTPDQRVFTEAQAGYRSFMIGGVFFDAGLEATYMPISPPVPRGAYLRATSSSLHVIGTVAGKSKAVFNFNSWIATKLYVSDNPR